MVSTVVYVYAVALAAAASGPEAGERTLDLTGIAGHPVRLVRGCGLVAAVSDVPAGEFERAERYAHAEDLAWLERTVRAHDRVVAALAERATMLPLRLGTIYRDQRRVRVMLAERGATFRSLLERLAGHVELGVKLYVLPHAAPSRGPDQDQPIGCSTPRVAGRAYLKRLQAPFHGGDQATAAAMHLAERIDAALRPLVTERRRHRLQDARLSEQPGLNVFNAAYLVRSERVDELRRIVRELVAQQPWIQVEVSGPFAPYSFAAPPRVHRGETDRPATPRGLSLVE